MRVKSHSDLSTGMFNRQLIIFFLFFPENRLWYLMKIFMKCQTLFSGKVREIIQMPSAEFINLGPVVQS